jgi:hypothetical protein
MDDKYNTRKSREPETKQEKIQHEIEELIQQRDKATSPAAKQAINTEMSRLFAQYERLKL